MNKRLALMIAFFFCMGLMFMSCAGVETKPSAADFKTPMIKGEYYRSPPV